MFVRLRDFSAFTLCQCLSVAVFFWGGFQAQSAEILLDGANEGRVFDGVGGVSAGASSRLLMDYPEPQRSQVLDYLFKPGFGASLHSLKVEIGGGVNSTDGTEPTHMRSREDQNYQRGFHWWLMKEARKRNPEIILDSLAWGAPGWIGNGSYFTDDMADYLANFLAGAKREHGLEIQYTGVINERNYNTDWIKRFRKTLDARGLGSVKIVGGDQVSNWGLADQMQADPELAAAVSVIGGHYSGFRSTASAVQVGKPLWASEDGPWAGDWAAARIIAQLLNRNYVIGQMSATLIWSLVSSYYEVLPLPDSGPMRAREPWSGHFEVQPALWALAHTGQFAKPGWRYLGGASALLAGGGSIVTLKAPDSSAYSIIIETTGASGPQTLRFTLANGLPASTVHVWRSTQGEQMKQLASVLPVGGVFSLTFQSEAIYSLTTTTGQSKGEYSAPASVVFPLPYQEDFEGYPLMATPRYLSDQAGTFEVIARADGQGQALRQVSTNRGIEWAVQFTPYTAAGGVSWTDYEISADVLLESDGYVSLFGRIGEVTGFSDAVPFGYYARLHSGDPGIWEIWRKGTLLKSGPASFQTNAWRNLRLALRGSSIELWLDNERLGEVLDGAYPAGLAGLGSGWHGAQFDNVRLRSLHGGRNLALGASMRASSLWSAEFEPRFAVDDDPATRWVAGFGTQDGEWIELDFGVPIQFNRAAVRDDDNRIKTGTWQYWNVDHWRTLVTGIKLAEQPAVRFPAVTSHKARFVVNSSSSTAVIREIQIFNDQPLGDLRINEWMTRNTSAVADPADGDFEPWFELWNAGANTLDLAGYSFGSTRSNRFEAVVPSGYTLGPGQFLRVWADGEPAQNTGTGGDLHVAMNLASAQVIGVYDPDGIQADYVQLFAQPENTSYGSEADGAAAVSQLAMPSAGYSNLPLVAVIHRAGNGVAIRLQGQPLASYELQSKRSLAEAVWATAGEARADAQGRVEFALPGVPENAAFFRVAQPR